MSTKRLLCVLAESDNESAPSSTPTKNVSPDDEQRIARNKSQELLLLEKIQAEAAAFYSYEALPPAPDPPKERKIVRANLSSKYDRLSLDEISGKQQQPVEGRNSLDFKILSLEEIRARKKETIVHTTPITLSLSSRKRKLSTQETITTSGNKIIKVVRSNSVVYKKVDHNAPAASGHTKVDQKQSDNVESRKRTLSEQSDVYEMLEDELVDNCYEFKRIKIAQHTYKPRLIRNRHIIIEKLHDNKNIYDSKDNEEGEDDEEVQIISVEIPDKDSKIDSMSDLEVIDVESTKICDPIDIVDLSEEIEENDVALSNYDMKLVENVPDVVASCRVNKVDNVENNLLKDIDCLFNDSLDSLGNVLDDDL